MGKLLVTKKVAAKDLSVSIRHLENLIKRRKLPVIRLGRAVRLRRDVIEHLAPKGA